MIYNTKHYNIGETVRSGATTSLKCCDMPCYDEEQSWGRKFSWNTNATL